MKKSNAFIIAEAGVNHNGNFDTAKQLVDAAAAAGVDAVKFQTFAAEELTTEQGKTAEYQQAAGFHNPKHMLQSLELPRDAYGELRTYAEVQDIAFLSTAFDIPSVDLLHSIGQKVWKIPSGEITNVPLLEAIAGLAEEIILSTGMATLEEIKQALGWLEAAGCLRKDITLLHCNTEYPTPYHDVNLRAMHALQQTFGVRVGYSDHTLGIEVPVAAVAMGALVIEKHFTLDRTLSGPDHKASLEPDELKAMVTAIRHIEQALGDGAKKVTLSEKKNITVARKSIVAACSITKGEQFTKANITVKRPGSGISAAEWYSVLGTQAARSYRKDEFIER